MPELPAAFKKRMQAQLGADYDDFYVALSGDVPSSIRLNPKKIQTSPFEDSTTIACHPNAYSLATRPSYVADPLFHAGAYYVQEASSMLLYQALDLSKDLRILDLCAAPGGKSTLVASEMTEGSLLVSNEVIPKRASVLAENITRWGYGNCVVTSAQPSIFGKLEESFDIILVDAPCSGEGMFRKEPHATSHWSEDAVETCAIRQKEILTDVLPCLKAGGTLIYSTCTFAPQENQQVIEWLLEQDDSLELYPIKNLEAFGSKALDISGVSKGGYACYPHKFQGEGFFISRLRKKGELSARSKADKEGVSFPKELEAYLNLSDDIFQNYKLQEIKGNQRLLPIDLSFLQEGKVKIVQAGVELGKLDKHGLRPAHGLALSNLIGEDVPVVELTKEEAQRYLLKEDLVKAAPIEKGWVLVRYQGVNLGWTKASQGRLNNYLPMNWRIRTQLDNQ